MGFTIAGGRITEINGITDPGTLRVFFNGACRKPRDVNWLIGITIFALALPEGLFG